LVEVHYATEFINQQATMGWANDAAATEASRSAWTEAERARAVARFAASTASKESWWDQSVDDGHALTTYSVQNTAPGLVTGAKGGKNMDSLGSFIQSLVAEWKKCLAVAAAAATLAAEKASIQATAVSLEDSSALTARPLTVSAGLTSLDLLKATAPAIQALLSSVEGLQTPQSTVTTSKLAGSLMHTLAEHLSPLLSDAPASMNDISGWTQDGSILSLISSAATEAMSNGTFRQGYSVLDRGEISACSVSPGQLTGFEGSASRPFTLNGAFLELLASQDSKFTERLGVGINDGELDEEEETEMDSLVNSLDTFSRIMARPLVLTTGEGAEQNTDSDISDVQGSSAAQLLACLSKDASFRALAKGSEGPSMDDAEFQLDGEDVEDTTTVVPSLTSKFDALALAGDTPSLTEQQLPILPSPLSSNYSHLAVERSALPPTSLRIFSPAGKHSGSSAALHSSTFKGMLVSPLGSAKVGGLGGAGAVGITASAREAMAAFAAAHDCISAAPPVQPSASTTCIASLSNMQMNNVSQSRPAPRPLASTSNAPAPLPILLPTPPRALFSKD